MAVLEPTRNSNILDLVLTNTDDIAHAAVLTVTGPFSMSDSNMVNFSTVVSDLRIGSVSGCDY